MGLFSLTTDALCDIGASDLPDKQKILEKEHQYRFTPDFYKLDKYANQFVFVADELMKAFPLHHNFLANARYFGTAYTRNVFTMFKHKCGERTHPVILPTKYHFPSSNRVKGELWLVGWGAIPFMDVYKQNGEVFERLRLKVDQPYRMSKTPWSNFDNRGLYFSKGMWYNIPKKTLTEVQMASIRAWMYLAIPSYWGPLLDGGYTFSPVKPLMSRNKDIGNYFYFSREELNRT